MKWAVFVYILSPRYLLTAHTPICFLEKNIYLLCVTLIDTDQRINDIAKRQGLDPSQLDVPCDKSHLLPISQLLVHWLSYCEYLGLTALQKNHIRTDQSLTAAHQKPEEMLKRWQEICADSKKSHYRYLLRGCIEINDNAQLVAVICDVIAKNPIG